MAYNWLGMGFLPLIIAYTSSFIALLIGSVTDLRTREVPDWMNYGLVISGFGLNLLFSAIYSNSDYIINSIVGFFIFFGIAYIMFYAGQWGGGDSKMLMGLGAMLGLDVSFKTPQFLGAFIVNILVAGAGYGLLWSLYLMRNKKKQFKKEFERSLKEAKLVRIKKILLIAVVILMLLLFFIKPFQLRILILSFAFIILTGFYASVFVKAIEKSCMYKLVEPSKLTEGDWIVNDIFVNKKYICGPKDLGIDKKQIKQLAEFYRKGKVKKILVKEGIPFVPSFLIAFVVTFFFGNPLMWWTLS